MDEDIDMNRLVEGERNSMFQVCVLLLLEECVGEEEEDAMGDAP